MKQKLIKKAQELRQHGFTTGEIADELNDKYGYCQMVNSPKTC